MRALSVLIGALWFGSGVFILLTAQAVFQAAGSPTIAAYVVGAVLTRWHYIALLAPVALIIVGYRQATPRRVAVLLAGVILAAMQSMLDLKIRAIRLESAVSISSLAGDDPVRRTFGLLHGLSSALLVLDVVLAALVMIRMSSSTRKTLAVDKLTFDDTQPDSIH